MPWQRRGRGERVFAVASYPAEEWRADQDRVLGQFALKIAEQHWKYISVRVEHVGERLVITASARFGRSRRPEDRHPPHGWPDGVLRRSLELTIHHVYEPEMIQYEGSTPEELAQRRVPKLYTRGAVRDLFYYALRAGMLEFRASESPTSVLLRADGWILPQR